MKKIWLLNTLLIISLLLTWCNKNIEEIENQNGSSWWFSTIIENNNATEIYEDETSTLPLCNDIDIDWDAEIINIDDVVENCTFEEWTAYSWNLWWCWWVEPRLYLTKDYVWVLNWNDNFLCKSSRVWEISSLLGHYQDIEGFVYNHNLQNKWIIDVILPDNDELYWNKCIYYCNNEDLCNQLFWLTYWENESHYFIHWYRYSSNSPYEKLLVIDDKLYRIWKYEQLWENWWPQNLKNWPRIVYWLDWDKLIVKRYVNWELISPYTLENFNSYNFEEKTTTTKFKIKTCEIHL